MSKIVHRGTLLMLTALSVAGAVEAQQTVQLPARDQALRDRPADVYTVGTVEGQDWEMFSSIRSVAFDRSDNMYLLDGQNVRVVVFDANGRYVRQFGKRGGGPGEFQAPLHMAIGSDGNIVVNDLGNRAFIIFSPSGDHIRNVPYGEDMGMPVGGMVADSRGGVIVRSTARIMANAPQTGDTRFSDIQRQQLEGNDVAPTTLYRVPVTPPRITDSGSSANARRITAIAMDPVFGPRPSYGALPAGLAVHHETEYAVKVLDANGQHVRTITRAYTPKRVTKRDQDQWHERRRNQEATGGGPAIVMSMSGGGGGQTRDAVSVGPAGGAGVRPMPMDDVPFAEVMSVVTSIRTDPQGRIWVQRRHSDGTADGSIDLVASDGRYIGTLPPQAMPNAVSASGLAAWIVRDDLGVERVAVRRLPATWR